MEQENFSPQQSLALIQSMLEKTRSNIGKNNRYFLLWGWVTFIACIGQFVLKRVLHSDLHSVVWLLVIPTVIINLYMVAREKRASGATTYVGDSMKYLWLGMGISYFVLSMILSRLGWDTTVFPFFMLLYGLGTFISGKFLQFTPLVLGGLAAWVLAVVAVYLEYDYQILCGAAAIMVSYIIPAYLLGGRKYNNTTN